MEKLSKDGKQLLCSCGAVVKIVETLSGKFIKAIGEEDDTNDLTTFALSPDETCLITSSKNGLLRRWNCDTNTIVRTWKSTHLGPISKLAFHSNSSLLASGGCDGTIKVWDLLKLYCTHNLTGAQGVFSVVQFHPNPETLQIFGTADDCKIHVWELLTSTSVAKLEGHFSPVTCLSFTPDNLTMISSGRDRVVFIWDLEDFKLKKSVPVFEEVESIFWLPKDRMLPNINVTTEELHFLTAGSKGVLKVWNARTASPVYSQESLLQEKTKSLPQITHAEYSEALDSVQVVTYEQNILFYKLQNLELSKQLIGNSEEVLDLALLGENESHMAVATNSALIKVFELASLDCQLLEGHTDLVLSLDSFPEKPLWMASAAKDSSVKLWQMDPTSKVISCMFTGNGHTQNVTAVACCRLGSLYIVSGSADTTLKLWQVPEKAPLVVTNPMLSSVFTMRAHQKEINTLDISPNNKLIISGSHDKTAKVWKAENLELCGTLQGHKKGIFCVRFSPVDQVVATSSADGTLKIWALNDYLCVKTFEGHECSVLKFCFLSRGMQLLSSSSDGNIKLWNIKANECVKTVNCHDDKVWALVLSKTEDWFLSGGADSKIVHWKDTTQEELEEILKNEEKLIIDEQEMQNLLQSQNWLKALKKAVHLEQPHRALQVVKEILLQSNFEANLSETLLGLDQVQTRALLKYCVVWNTNSKHCAPAQAVLKVLLSQWTPETLLTFPEIKETVEGFLPYTERHYRRLQLLQQQGTFVDYLWKTMKVADNT